MTIDKAHDDDDKLLSFMPPPPKKKSVVNCQLVVILTKELSLEVIIKK